MKLISVLLVLLVGLQLVFASTPTNAPTGAPTKAPTICSPQVGMNRNKCTPLVRFCATAPMRWTGTGCKSDGRRLYDGGCQCASYCGFSCKQACTARPNRNTCMWRNGACYNRATGLIGTHMPHCEIEITSAPTVPTTAPSNSPTATTGAPTVFA